jgi:MFS family permease
MVLSPPLWWKMEHLWRTILSRCSIIVDSTVVGQGTPGRGAAAATSTPLAVYVAYNAAAAVVSVPAGRLSDRRVSVGVLAAGAALFATAYTGLAVTGPAVAVLAGCFVLAGAAIGCVETAQHTAVATLAPTDVRGSAFGLLAATQAFGNLIASSVAGAVWTLVRRPPRSATPRRSRPPRAWPCSQRRATADR